MDTDQVFCKCEPRIKGKKHWAVGGAGGTGLIAGWGRSPGEENDNRLQSCLENPVDRGAWRAIVQGVAGSRTRLSDEALLGLPAFLSRCV